MYPGGGAGYGTDTRISGHCFGNRMHKNEGIFRWIDKMCFTSNRKIPASG